MQTNPTYGAWTVYDDYIAHTNGYELTAFELYHNRVDWVRHLSEKRWFVLVEFLQARDHLLGLRIRQEAA